ncbi:hypothetical protein [Streptomyces sp. NPDC050164]|uniref:hypothetical protein n=1 Tax=Streptomyces sp. NPDC050164 TaxID=3365605 RepID=UPI0037B1C32A
MHERDRKTKHQKTLDCSSSLDVVDQHVKAVWSMAESIAHAVRSTSAGTPLSAARTRPAAVTAVVGLRETRPDTPVINATPGAAA